MAQRKGKKQKLEAVLDQQASEDAATAEPSVNVAATGLASGEAPQAAATQKAPLKLSFFARSYVEKKFPESVSVVDQVVSDWISGGDFQSLPLKNPKAKKILQKGLLETRETFQKLEPQVLAYWKELQKAVQKYSLKTRL